MQVYGGPAQLRATMIGCALAQANVGFTQAGRLVPPALHLRGIVFDHQFDVDCWLPLAELTALRGSYGSCRINTVDHLIS
jgi:hypothetical protein